MAKALCGHCSHIVIEGLEGSNQLMWLLALRYMGKYVEKWTILTKFANDLMEVEMAIINQTKRLDQLIWVYYQYL